MPAPLAVLEDTYSAFGRIETGVEALGQQLEHEHARLDEGMKRYGQAASERDVE